MPDFSILYLGMFGALSRHPLAALLEAGLQVSAVIVPGTETDDPDPGSLDPPNFEGIADLNYVAMVSQYLQPSIVTLAWEHHLPLLSIYDFARPAAYAALAAFQPDLICVSCFSRIIPPSILSLPKFGAINLHPSLLPAYRGPWPLFWQFRQGEAHTGATVHFMTPQVDAGDILTQAEVAFAEGITGTAAERLCAEVGSRLMVEGVNLIRAGNPPRRPQVESLASYYPRPSQAELAIRPTGPARRAFNFIRGAGSLIGQVPFEIVVGETSFYTREAIEYSAEGILGDAYRRQGDSLWVQFEPGILKVKVQ